MIGIGMVLPVLMVFSQQTTIPRIESMPNIPSPYAMRDWRAVAEAYDAIVFDQALTGQYLPLVFLNPSSVNYPEHAAFGLHSYVGTDATDNGEAINGIPAVVGATLVNIDKSDQVGFNWVLFCEDWFNRRPEENVYLNSPIASSGSDWWYDTMPNVFFFQLADLYPGIGDFDNQIVRVADQWLAAVRTMGGSQTPWTRPNMNYRAWSLSTMQPLVSGVLEPEAAGAIAWILFNAYLETGNQEYRIGAEWAMEFLNARSSNPSYELQLPYGVYAAARMNALLKTQYDIEKMLNWCFDPQDNVREWGATLGTWGIYDCDGLIGEAKYSGYAFLMNGFQQAAALVPMVRYDDRFCRAVGKWVLNLANATRLFYPAYLPDDFQDSELWSKQYDPQSVIGHESMRESWMGKEPYATGDAISGGWSQTNLCLYGSSHVGYLGSMVDTTDVPMILKLDVLKTDFYSEDRYPTYLYFNPYETDQDVGIDLGSGSFDLYDAVSNGFLATGVSGPASFSIPSNSAVLVSVVPSGGAVTTHLDELLIDGIVVDYRSGQTPSNFPPRIKSLAAETETVNPGQEVTLYATTSDRDGGTLEYSWNASAGLLEGSGAVITWTAPDSGGTFTLSCRVGDGQGGEDVDSLDIVVVDNRAPVILSITADPRKMDLGSVSLITCLASDPDSDTLNYHWSCPEGVFDGSGSEVQWTAPDSQGYRFIVCEVGDGHGGLAVDSVGVVVQDFLDLGTGIPIAFYPFSGNAEDESGFGNHGTLYGAALVSDRFGNPEQAYSFDGVNDRIQVPNSSMLNFQEAISISFWMTVDGFFSREAHPISHGSWENRWKISIIPEKKLRWTVKTDNPTNSGIKDLDSILELAGGTLYHVVVTFDGYTMAIYFDGALDKQAPWSGRILKTSLDMTIGQVLPNNSQYNFKGVLDDIRLYDYALTEQEIQNLYEESTPVESGDNPSENLQPGLQVNYPNPFNAETTIQYQVSRQERVHIEIRDIRGTFVACLADRIMPAGSHEITWDGRGHDGKSLPSGIYLCLLKTDSFARRIKMTLIR